MQLPHDFPTLPLVVLSPLAEGGDQMVAEEALALGARLIAPLPLPRDLYIEDFHHPEAHVSFDALCARARVIDLPSNQRQPKGSGSFSTDYPSRAMKLVPWLHRFGNAPGLSGNGSPGSMAGIRASAQD